MQNYLKETTYRYYSPVIVAKIPTNGDAEAAPLASSKAPLGPPMGGGVGFMGLISLMGLIGLISLMG